MQFPKKRFKTFPLYLLAATILVTILSFAFKTQEAVKKEATQKCLIVSDIHFNPLSGASLSDTTLKRKLERMTFDQWKQYFESSAAQMRLDPTLLFQDANYAVLRSTLYNMKKRLPHPPFIMIAGDFIWHGATPADSVLKKKSIQFIARLFKENFPGALIIPAMGNNDTYGSDYKLQDQKFLNDFANAWAPNLPGPASDLLKANGYYTCETGNLKVIVLNSALLNSGTRYPQAREMFSWLKNNLANANGKNIWIMMHIPPGINAFNGSKFWNAEYTREFADDIVKYAPEVRLMIASHTHFNEFKVVYDNSKIPEPVALLRIVPSVCSNHGNYPSFEVAEFNSSTNQVIHETNYYLNLKSAAANKSKTETAWPDSVGVNSTLRLAETNAADFSKLIDNIKNDKKGQILKNYIHFFTVGADADSTMLMNSRNYLKYLKADSLKGD